MKRVVFIYLAILTTFTSNTSAQRLSLPYFDDFESGAAGWTTDNRVHSNTVWELGEPSVGFTIGAYSGTNCWDVNLNNDYTFNANSNLVSPVFDFTNVNRATVSFWTKYRTEYLWDYLSVQYSVDSGFNWNYLPFPELIHPSGQVNRWIQSSLTIYDLIGFSDVQFRFKFVSDGSVNYEGYSIDDFRIEIEPLSSPHLSGDPFSFSFFPNPSKGNLNFSFVSIPDKAANISVFDINGNLVFLKPVDQLISGEVYIPGLSNGVYSVLYQDSHSTEVRKLVVAH